MPRRTTWNALIRTGGSKHGRVRNLYERELFFALVEPDRLTRFEGLGAAAEFIKDLGSALRRDVDQTDFWERAVILCEEIGKFTPEPLYA